MEGRAGQVELSKDGLLRASREIQKGSVVLQVTEVAAGPGRGRAPLCLGCLSPGGEVGLAACSSCGWPVCGPACQTGGLHDNECSVLAKAGLAYSAVDRAAVTHHLDCILPLRILLKAQGDPVLKEKLWKLSVDIEDTKQRNSSVYGDSSDGAIIETITKKLKRPTDEASVERAIAIVEKYSIVLDASRGTVGVFPEVAQLTPSCSPSTFHSCWIMPPAPTERARIAGAAAAGSARGLLVRAARNLEEGEVVTWCKVDTAKCNLFRRRQLRDALVECRCARCLDGTELGTGFGSVSCPACPGLLASTDPAGAVWRPMGASGGVRGVEVCEGVEWRCADCGKTRPGKECIAILEHLAGLLQEEERSLQEHPDNYEKILLGEGEWADIPPGSQLFYDVRHRLVNLYQYHKDFYFGEEAWLRRKIAHVEVCLRVKQLLFPGWSYPWVLLMSEKLNSNVALLITMKNNGAPLEVTNSMISEITKIPNEPIEMLITEEDQSLINTFRDSMQIAVEARESQKTRVFINPAWGEDDDDWTGYT